MVILGAEKRGEEMKRAYEVHIHYNSNDNALEKAVMIGAIVIR